MSGPIKTEYLVPIERDDLVRVGNVHDGGYIVPRSTLGQIDGVLSFGLNLDWTFERDLKSRNKSLKIHCYDHTVSGRKAFEFSVRSLVKLLIGRGKFEDVVKYLDYKNFFQHDVVHYQQRIWRDSARNSATVKDAIERMAGARHILLKVDIEGSEYRVLGDILQNSANIAVMIVEFHELDIMPEAFNHWMAAILEKFYLVHIHGNNHADLTEQAIPILPELTFINKVLVKGDVRPSRVKRPIMGLDTPNDPTRPDWDIVV